MNLKVFHMYSSFDITIESGMSSNGFKTNNLCGAHTYKVKMQKCPLNMFSIIILLLKILIIFFETHIHIHTFTSV